MPAELPSSPGIFSEDMDRRRAMQLMVGIPLAAVDAYRIAVTVKDILTFHDGYTQMSHAELDEVFGTKETPLSAQQVESDVLRGKGIHAYAFHTDAPRHVGLTVHGTPDIADSLRVIEGTVDGKHDLWFPFVQSQLAPAGTFDLGIQAAGDHLVLLREKEVPGNKKFDRPKYSFFTGDTLSSGQAVIAPFLALYPPHVQVFPHHMPLGVQMDAMKGPDGYIKQFGLFISNESRGWSPEERKDRVGRYEDYEVIYEEKVDKAGVVSKRLFYPQHEPTLCPKPLEDAKRPVFQIATGHNTFDTALIHTTHPVFVSPWARLTSANDYMLNHPENEVISLRDAIALKDSLQRDPAVVAYDRDVLQGKVLGMLPRKP